MKTVVAKRRNPPVFILFGLGSMAQCLGPLVHPLPATLKKEVRELTVQEAVAKNAFEKSAKMGNEKVQF